jgi:RNA polymerase sigma factor (sigma-70 family)
MQADDDILRHIASGDVKAAFTLLMAQYRGKVYRLCVAYLRDPTVAQDVAQDSLVRVWRALPRYDGRTALSTYIYVITRNRCLTALATRSAGISMSEPWVQAEMDRRHAHDQQAARDLGQTLRQFVEQLPDPARRVVTLYYFEEESLAEVSALLGMPEGTVKTILFRARRQLRARFEAQGMGNRALWHP